MEIKNMNINSNLMQAVTELGYTEATGIQEKCIPEILAGKDIFGHSSTGSGKTAAFGLPIIERIERGKPVQVLILTPTRELCVQVSEAILEFGHYLHVR